MTVLEFTGTPVGRIVMISSAIGVVTGAVIGTTSVVQLFEPWLPATRGYVLVQMEKNTLETRELKGRVIELQMQQNTGRRDTFRKEEFDRQQELQKDPGNFAVKQRLDQVRDELEAIKRDRDKLEKERGN